MSLVSIHPEQHRIDEWSRLIIDAAPNAMILADAAQAIVLVNQGAERMFGYARDELVGQPIELLVPDRYQQLHPSHVRGFLAQPEVRPMGAGRDLYGRRRDGTEVPVEIGLTPIVTPDGRFTLAAIIDISERKRAEAAHERLAAIVESSQDAIMSRDLDGAITSWNPAAERMFGYTAAEAIGQSVWMLTPERLRDEDAQRLAQIWRGEQLPRFETVRRRKDGSELDVSVAVSPIRDARGQMVGVAGIIRDITELKRRDAELARSNAELEQFAYVASHDLQEPLRMVANYTELLAQRYRSQLDERADKYIHYAVDGARRMQHLVSDLLAYSRVGSQGKPLAPVAAGAVLDQVLESLQRLVRETGATMERGPLPAVLADEGQLHQLLQNLIGNAIKFRSEAPPRITVTAAPSGDRWRFSVADNGIGIERQYADRIFQMFQRLHERSKYEGSGIGLAIAKRIVERHGGHIWFESQPGAGTTFHFTLRAAREAPR